MEPAACLARYPLFALLGAQSLEAWAACGKVQAVQTGETIFEAGTPGTWAFLVLEGQVRVLRSSGPDRDVSLGVFGPGQVFVYASEAATLLGLIGGLAAVGCTASVAVTESYASS